MSCVLSRQILIPHRKPLNEAFGHIEVRLPVVYMVLDEMNGRIRILT